jgi:hypothetical protein
LHRGPISGLAKLEVDSRMPNPLAVMQPACHVLKRANINWGPHLRDIPAFKKFYE